MIKHMHTYQLKAFFLFGPIPIPMVQPLLTQEQQYQKLASGQHCRVVSIFRQFMACSLNNSYTILGTQ